MPAKYIFQIPEPVTVVGWIHGALFLFFIILLVGCWIKYRWSFYRVVVFFIGSLVPFAPFILDKKLKKEYMANA